MTVTVDKFGRVLIPKKLRDQLGLRPGSKVAMTEHDGRLDITPQDEEEDGWIIAEDGLPLFTREWPKEWPADFDIVNWHREERIRELIDRMGCRSPFSTPTFLSPQFTAAIL